MRARCSLAAEVRRRWPEVGRAALIGRGSGGELAIDGVDAVDTLVGVSADELSWEERVAGGRDVIVRRCLGGVCSHDVSMILTRSGEYVVVQQIVRAPSDADLLWKRD